jgi:hypothetical protein
MANIIEINKTLMVPLVSRHLQTGNQEGFRDLPINDVASGHPSLITWMGWEMALECQ